MDFNKLAKNAAIDAVVSTLVEVQRTCNGTVPSGMYTQALEGLRAQAIVMSRDALWKRVQRASNPAASNPTPRTPNEPPPTSHVAFAQNSTPSSSSLAVSSVSTPTLGTTPPSNDVRANDDNNTEFFSCDSQHDTTPNDNVIRNKGGRPKGTSIVQQKEEEDRYKKCVNEVATEYAAALAVNSTFNTKQKGGLLPDIIAAKKKKFNITKRDIPENTIKSRITRNRKDPTKHKLEADHPGISSPLALAEQAVLQMCLGMQKIRQPLTKVEAIALMNDAIKDTPAAEEFRRMKSTRAPPASGMGEDDEGEEDDLVGEGWWRLFNKRNRAVLSK